MVSPTQGQGIVNLLASELKARDAKAKQQIGSLMAGQPDPNSIMAQNEKEVENSVRQEIGQKMQARVMQERQAQARQRQALAGIAGQRAPNMRMADGGIVGYAEGGPTLGAVSPKAADPQDVKRLADLYRQAQASMDAATDPTAKAAVQQRLNDLKTQMGDQLPFVMQYLDSTKGIIEPRTKMAEGGIIGFKEGDYVGGITGPMGIFAPGINKGIGFADFLARKGVESLAGLSADAVNRLRQEYEAMQAREMDRPRGDSVSESQMENLSGVLKGAGNVLTEGIASLAPEPQGRNRTELADMGGAPGAGGAPQARREPSAAALADAQAEMDILNAAQQRRDEAERAARGPQPYVLSDLAKGAGLEGFFSGIPSFEEMYPPNPEDASLAYKVGSATRALRTPFQVLSGFLQPKDEDQLTFSDIGPIASEFTAGLTGAEMPTQQTDEEAAQVAQEIIDTGVTSEQYREATGPTAPTAPTIDRSAVDAGSALAREVETTPSGEEGAARAAGVITGRGGEAAAVELASTVAQNPTPENTNRFESEIQRLMERRESPMRALSSFLTSFSQARGGSLGQNIGIASTALRAADDALDKQIVELEKLRRADQISERDFGLKQNQLDAQKDLIAAQASYYSNYQSMQENIQRIRAEQGDRAANARLLGDITTAYNSNYFRYIAAASKLLGIKDLNDAEVTKKAGELMRDAINTEFMTAQQQLGLAGTGSSTLDDTTKAGLRAYVGQQ